MIPRDIPQGLHINAREVDDYAAQYDPTEKQFIKSAAQYGPELNARLFGPQVPKKPGTPFPTLGGDLEFRPGELTMWGGYNGHRKSMLTSQMALWWMAQGQKVCIASFEMQPVTTLQRMATQAARNPKPSEQYVGDWLMWLIGKMWIYDQQGSVHPQRVLNVARYFAGVLKGQHLVVDSLMKCGIPEKDSDQLQWFMNELTAVAADTGLHIHLIHHVTKPEGQDEGVIPSKYGLKGTGNLSDQASNVLLIWQDKRRQHDPETPEHDPNALLIVAKQRNAEFEGKVRLKFDNRSLHHLEQGQRYPFDWRQK